MTDATIPPCGPVELFRVASPTAGRDSLWRWLRYWRGVSILAPDGARLTYTNGRLTHVNDWSLWS